MCQRARFSTTGDMCPGAGRGLVQICTGDRRSWQSMASGSPASFAILSARNPQSAAGFTINEVSFTKFVQQVEVYWTKAILDDALPLPDNEVKWTVYLVEQSGLYKHQSLALQFGKCGVFTMELFVEEGGGVVPKSRMLDPEHPPCDLTLTLLGNITTTAHSFFEKALTCLERYGDYNDISNNCQGYCKALAKEYELDTGLTDVDKTAVGIGIGTVVLAAAAIAFGAWWSSGKKDKKDN